MEDMTTCKLCTLREQGQTERAEKLKGIHTQRLILAAVNGTEVSRDDLLAEVDNCVDCALNLITSLAFYNAQALWLMHGRNVEAVKQSLELGLMEDLNDLPPDDKRT